MDRVEIIIGKDGLMIMSSSTDKIREYGIVARLVRKLKEKGINISKARAIPCG